MTKHPSLREIQEFICWIVTDPGGLSALADKDSSMTSVWLGGHDWKAVIAPREGLTPVRRLDVYAGGYPTRIFEALSEMFPSVKRVLGDSAFLSLASRYIQTYPSNDYSLSTVGEKLPEFLPSDPLTDGLPFLPDLAILDRSVMRAFHAWAYSLVSPEDLAALNPEKFANCRVRFQPQTFLMSSKWPVATIREMREVPDKEFHIRVEGNPEYVAVYRSGYDVIVRKLGAAEYSVLERLIAGSTVWDALERTSTLMGDGVPVGSWFRNWTATGMITRIDTP